MYVVINYLSIKSDWADKVKTAFMENSQGIEKQPGYVGFHFLVPENPDEMPHLVQTQWENKDAFEQWKASEHFKQSHVGMRGFKDAFYAPPKLGVYTA